MRYLILLLASLFSCQLYAGEVEVLHWWADGSEAKAIAELRHELEQQGDQWRDFAVVGGGGGSAMAVLKIRAISGNPPTAAQLKKMDIREWASLGFLSDLSPIAKQEQWDSVLPSVVADAMKYQGHYVGVPINIHRVNWLWINRAIFDSLGLEPPRNLDALLQTAHKVSAAGYIALAHGSQRWQDATLFEAIALAFLGTEGYRKAFVEHHPATLAGKQMVAALRYFKQLNQFVDRDAADRDWLQTTAMLTKGKAAMLIMGDWSKGEFSLAGKLPEKDYYCIPVPGTEQAFTYNIDSFVMFRVPNQTAKLAQQNLTRTMLKPDFQRRFNQYKGSIPARMDLSAEGFDSCALRAMSDFRDSLEHGGLVPSWAHGMATNSQIQEAMTDVISNFFNSTDMTPEKAAQQLARAVRSAM